jgi:aspartate kinase
MLGPHRDEIRRHLDGRDRAHPPRRRHRRRQQAAGHEVAVVVSAMAGETDRLVNFCREANPLYDPAEYDVVVASGEQVTSGLLALHPAGAGLQGALVAWLAIADPHRRCPCQGADRGYRFRALIASMAAGEIAVIPGFQGLFDPQAG